MSDTAARIGHGNLLEIALASAPSSFTYIREVFEGAPPSDSDDQVDASHFQSPNRTRQYIPGMTDSGEASFQMNYVPGSATDRFLRSIKGKSLVVRYTFANGCQLIFSASRQSYEQSNPIDDKMTATLTLKVSGDPTMTEPTAPRNVVVPAITGTAQVGVPLTVDPGDWAGAMDITFQWQKDDAGNGTFANIAGATSTSYVPVAGDQGDDVRCTVTAANDDFETTVNTTETAAVAAAA